MADAAIMGLVCLAEFVRQVIDACVAPWIIRKRSNFYFLVAINFQHRGTTLAQKKREYFETDL